MRYALGESPRVLGGSGGTDTGFSKSCPCAVNALLMLAHHRLGPPGGKFHQSTTVRGVVVHRSVVGVVMVGVVVVVVDGSVGVDLYLFYFF